MAGIDGKQDGTKSTKSGEGVEEKGKRGSPGGDEAGVPPSASASADGAPAIATNGHALGAAEPEHFASGFVVDAIDTSKEGAADTFGALTATAAARSRHLKLRMCRATSTICSGPRVCGTAQPARPALRPASLLVPS